MAFSNFLTPTLQNLDSEFQYDWSTLAFMRTLDQQISVLKATYNFVIIINNDDLSKQCKFILEKKFDVNAGSADLAGEDGTTDENDQLITFQTGLNAQALDTKQPFILTDISYTALTLNDAVSYYASVPGDLIDITFQRPSTVFFDLSSSLNGKVEIKMGKYTIPVNQIDLNVILTYLITWGQTVEV